MIIIVKFKLDSLFIYFTAWTKYIKIYELVQVLNNFWNIYLFLDIYHSTKK